MSVGVTLSFDDLQAVSRLYYLRWFAEIKNWKERDTNYCLWFVSCSDSQNNIITETGQSLANTIDKLLQRALE